MNSKTIWTPAELQDFEADGICLSANNHRIKILGLCRKREDSDSQSFVFGMDIEDNKQRVIINNDGIIIKATVDGDNLLICEETTDVYKIIALTAPRKYED